MNEIKVSQAEIDRGRRMTAHQVVEDRKLETLEDAKQFAEKWIVSSMQHVANEEYYRTERDRLLAEREGERLQLISAKDLRSELMQIRDLLIVPGDVLFTFDAVRAKIQECERWATEVGRLRTLVAELRAIFDRV
jgi:hypothetical protein